MDKVAHNQPIRVTKNTEPAEMHEGLVRIRMKASPSMEHLRHDFGRMVDRMQTAEHVAIGERFMGLSDEALRERLVEGRLPRRRKSRRAG